MMGQARTDSIKATKYTRGKCPNRRPHKTTLTPSARIQPTNHDTQIERENYRDILMKYLNELNHHTYYLCVPIPVNARSRFPVCFATPPPHYHMNGDRMRACEHTTTAAAAVRVGRWVRYIKVYKPLSRRTEREARAGDETPATRVFESIYACVRVVVAHTLSFHTSYSICNVYILYMCIGQGDIIIIFRIEVASRVRVFDAHRKRECLSVFKKNITSYIIKIMFAIKVK